MLRLQAVGGGVWTITTTAIPTAMTVIHNAAAPTSAISIAAAMTIRALAIQSKVFIAESSL